MKFRTFFSFFAISFKAHSFLLEGSLLRSLGYVACGRCGLYVLLLQSTPVDDVGTHLMNVQGRMKWYSEKNLRGLDVAPADEKNT